MDVLADDNRLRPPSYGHKRSIRRTGGHKNNIRHLSSSSAAVRRPTKNIQTIISAHRRLHRNSRQIVRPVSPAAVVTVRSPAATRRRLAKTLLLLAVLFVVCWVPYSIALLVCSIYDTSVTTSILQACLLLAHSHAAFSPLIYWLMTRSCADCVRSVCLACTREGPIELCVQSCVCMSQPRTSTWVHNSSTNEENLGPFHPRYLNPKMIRPQTSRCTSQYFH